MKIKIFLLFLICAALFTFHYWMAFPGYIVADTHDSLNLIKNDWHPVIISYALQLLYFFFGRHVYLFLLLQLVPLYLGIFLITLAFFKRYNFYWSFLSVFPFFIGNIFFQNFILHSSSLSPMWIFLFYSLVFYQIMDPPKTVFMKIFLWSCVISMFFLSLISRHNAIFQVYPACFIWIYQLSKDKKLNCFKLVYLIVLTALLTLNFVIHIPRWISYPTSIYSAYPIYLHQIVGTCVLAKDSKCIPLDWYAQGRNWNNAVNLYSQNPSYAGWTYVYMWRNNIFKEIDYNQLKLRWKEIILEYPTDYLIYIYRNFFIPFLKGKQWHINFALKMCPKDERLRNVYGSESNTFYFIEYSLIQENLYAYLDKYFPIIPNYVFFSFCVVVSIFSFIKSICKKCDDILIFIFITSFGGFVGGVFFCLFTPAVENRYLYPVLISAILSLYGIEAYILDRLYQKCKLNKTLD